MIVSILMATFIITAIAVLCGIVFCVKSRTYYMSICFGIALCISLLFVCGIFNLVGREDLNSLQIQYANIMLYNEVVEVCDNEQVRFGHYEKIEAYNEAYENFAETANDVLIGSLMPKNWSEGISKIDFYFRGVNYEYED